MSSTTIKTYRNNTEKIQCRVTGLDTLSGYTGTLTVKDEIYGTEYISIPANSIADMNIYFTVDPTNNNIEAGTYIYDITVSDGIDNYTIVQGKYVVLESVRYSIN